MWQLFLQFFPLFFKKYGLGMAIAYDEVKID